MIDLMRIANAYGETVGRACARRVMKAFVKITDAQLSGDDSGLENTWEEFCVQVRGQHSIFWEVYVEMMESSLSYEVDKLPYPALQAAWLCTPEGEEWQWTEEDEREEPHLDKEYVARWVYNSHLINLAEHYTNKRIEEYIENSYLD